MSETRGLLERVAALRHEREYPTPAPAPVQAPSPPPKNPSERLAALQKQAATGERQDAQTDRQIKGLAAAPSPAAENLKIPRQLTTQARRLLERSLHVLADLRVFTANPLLQDEAGPWAGRYTEITAMAEAAIRLLQGMPESTVVQARLCIGLHGILDIVTGRVASLSSVLARHAREQEQVEALTHLLQQLHDHHQLDLARFAQLAEELLDEARDDQPLRFLEPGAGEVGRWVAFKGLSAARLIARVSRSDPDARSDAAESVLAALVYEAGMLGVPSEVLFHPGSLEQSQRRLVESHAHQCAEILRRASPGAPEWLVEAVAGHHERLDGSGYPAGLREGRLSPVAKLLAVCDVYTALASPRPWRAAHDTRQAMIETLRLAEQGLLDRAHAARLLQLGFYPAGTAVELADGSFGVVVGTHPSQRNARTPSRPIIALLTDTEGSPLPQLRHADLEKTDQAIVRSLSSAERRERLDRHHPDWAS